MERLILLLGIGLIAWVLFGAQPAATPEPAPQTAAAVRNPPDTGDISARAGNGIAEFATNRAPDGHFYADVRINGASVRMLIDTGATTTLLSRNDARRAGIQARPGEFNQRGRTVGGDIALKPVTIGRMALGPVIAHNVPAMVAEADVPISLLGQSFLRRVGRVEIEGDRLVLR